MKRGRTTPMIDGDEYDRLTKKGRRVHVYRKWQSWLKRKYNKRDRKRARRDLTDMDSCGSLLLTLDEEE